MEWDCGTLTIEIPATDGTGASQSMKIGWIYTAEAEYKPIIAQKPNDGEKINSGDVYYRYRARSEKIKFAEMSHILLKHPNCATVSRPPDAPEKRTPASADLCGHPA